MANELSDSVSFPEDKLPECWKDEARINVLFAPFRNRSVNSQDWDSKLSFWKNMISLYCSHCKVYAFTVPQILKVFNRDGRSPGCLPVVIEEMRKSTDLKTTEEFLKLPPQTWTGWATNVVKTPMMWSYNKIKSSLATSTTDLTYVHIAAVQTEANNLLSLIPEDYKNKVISLQELLDITKLQISSVDNLKLLLHYLVCLQKVDIKELPTENQAQLMHNLLIKFGDIKKIKPISETDIAIHALEQNEKILTKSLEKLESDISLLRDEAKQYLKRGLRQMAKTSLRKKQEIEKRMMKRANGLQNVQVLLSRVRDTDTDSQIFESYKLVLSTLKGTFKDSGLNEDAVADTMVELGDVLDMHNEIQHTLSQSLTEDDVDLEEELAELIKSDDPSNPRPPPAVLDDSTDDLEKRLKELNLPEVPTTSIGVDKSKISLS